MFSLIADAMRAQDDEADEIRQQTPVTPTQPQQPTGAAETATETDDETQTHHRRDHNVTFTAIYRAFHETFEVSIQKRIPDENSPYPGGHVVISHPEWDQTRIALMENITVEIEQK